MEFKCTWFRIVAVPPLTRNYENLIVEIKSNMIEKD